MSAVAYRSFDHLAGGVSGVAPLLYPLMDLQTGFHVIDEGRGGSGLIVFGESDGRCALFPRRTRPLRDARTVGGGDVRQHRSACTLGETQPLLLNAPQRVVERLHG